MTATLLELGALRARLTGGTDGRGGGDGPLVVLLHGFGAPGDDLVPLWRVLPAPPGTRYLFPEAPLGLPPAFGPGRAWWMIDVARLQEAMMRGTPRDLSQEHPEALPAVRAALIELLDAAAAQLGVPPERTVLGGFSQGAMLSMDVALHDARPLAGLALLSGTYLARDWWSPRLASRAGLPVFQSHGKDDMVLEYAGGAALHEALREAGLEAELVSFRGGHAIPPPALEGLGAFLTRVLP
ncbi:MAG: esterase [Myxococcota bacterium]